MAEQEKKDDTDKGEDKNETPEVKAPSVDKKEQAEIKRMAAALEKIQKEKAELEEKVKKAEREKMTEEERIRADLAEVRKEKANLERENAKNAAEIAMRDQVDNLLDLGLKNRKFAKFILEDWDDQKESIDEFVARAKEDNDLKVFFRGEDGDNEERPRVPSGPGVSSNRANKVAEASADDRAWASRQYPNNPAMQKRVLEHLKKARVKRDAEEADFGR